MSERKPIKGFEGSYEIDNQGNIYSLDRYIQVVDHDRRYLKLIKGRKLVWVIDGTGYATVRIRANNGVQQTYRIHRLVAETFIPNPKNYNYVNHKDENRLNNDVNNLEWCTCEYNLNYGTARQRQSESLKKYYREQNKSIPVWGKWNDSDKWVRYGSLLEASQKMGCAYNTVAKGVRGLPVKGYMFKSDGEFTNEPS